MHSTARRGGLARYQEKTLCLRILLEGLEPGVAGGRSSRSDFNFAEREPRLELAGKAAVLARILEHRAETLERGGRITEGGGRFGFEDTRVHLYAPGVAIAGRPPRLDGRRAGFGGASLAEKRISQHGG